MTPEQQLIFRCIFIAMAGVCSLILAGYLLQIRSEKRAKRLEKEHLTALRRRLNLPEI